MSEYKQIEIIRDWNKTLFIGPAKSGKTRLLISETLRNYGPVKETEIYAIDPLGDIETSIKINDDKYLPWQIEKIKFVKSCKELPEDLKHIVLMIDDGRGYYSLLEHGISVDVKAIFCTVAIAKPIETL